jgi:hypothetical protein
LRAYARTLIIMACFIMMTCFQIAECRFNFCKGTKKIGNTKQKPDKWRKSIKKEAIKTRNEGARTRAIQLKNDLKHLSRLLHFLLTGERI